MSYNAFMNIAIVVYAHYSRDARVRRYAESLARKGDKVDCLCLNEVYKPKEKNITLIKYPLQRRRLYRFWYIIEYLLFFLYSSFILFKNYPFKRYQVIHINNMPEELVFTALIPKIFGARVILDMHDPMPELYMSKYHVGQNCQMVKWLKWLEKISFAFADKIITANKAFQLLFLKRNKISPEKISVILNCPDPRIFSPQLTTHNPQLFTLLYMGTVDERFGLDIVLEAIPEIIKQIPNLRFIIIPKLEDEGEYFKNFKFQIGYPLGDFKLEKYIKIFPPQPLENIAKYIKQADVGVVLAKNGVFTENIFPVKLLEFIQMGVPVIATKTKVLGQYFDDQQIYFLKKNTPNEFAKAVLNLYKDKKLRQNFTQKAKEYLKEYNWTCEEKKYLDIINQLLI